MRHLGRFVKAGLGQRHAYFANSPRGAKRWCISNATTGVRVGFDGLMERQRWASVSIPTLFVAEVKIGDHRRSLCLCRADHPWPFGCARAEVLRYGILSDVVRFKLELGMIPNAVVEKVVLPMNTQCADLPRFPTAENQPHVPIEWKAQQRMKVVGHDQQEMTVPSITLVIEECRFEERVGRLGFS